MRVTVQNINSSHYLPSEIPTQQQVDQKLWMPFLLKHRAGAYLMAAEVRELEVTARVLGLA